MAKKQEARRKGEAEVGKEAGGTEQEAGRDAYW